MKAQSASKEIQELSDAAATEPGRRAASEIKRIDGPRGGPAEPELQLATKRTEVLLNGHVTPHRDSEIAVGAAASAKGNVHVNVAREHSERYPPPHRRSASSSPHFSGERKLDGATELESRHRRETAVHRQR